MCADAGVGPTLEGDVVQLRPVTAADAPRLTEILGETAVAEWWGRWDLERVQTELITRHDGDATVVLAIEADEQVIGLIQYLEEEDPEYHSAGIDISLHPGWHHRGLGADALRTLANYLITERGLHRLTIDPAAENPRAIRSYERVGFRPVGVMRRYSRGPDGTWRDGLLMDLLAEELT
jgi:aminoglycoside 6'-N-acetyltransferase